MKLGKHRCSALGAASLATEDDVRFGRLLAEAVTRYAAELERLAAKDPATAADPDESGQAA